MVFKCSEVNKSDSVFSGIMVRFSERIWYFSSLIQEEKIAVIDQKWGLAVVIYKFFVLIFLVT